MAKITENLIEMGMSDKKAWSRAQLALIGVEWPPLKGWKSRIIGKEISEADAEKFVKLNNSHLKNI